MKIYYLLLGILLVNFASGIRINEVMYNPIGSDDNKEFIEVYGTNNLTNYTVGDLHSNDSLTLLQFFNSNYSLIVEEGFNYSNINSSVYSVGAGIGNGLGNSGDSIFLYFNNSLIANFTYDGSLANDNDKSIEYFEGEYFESVTLGGTPGRKNNQSKEISNISSENNTFCNVSLNLEIKNPKIYYEDGETIEYKNVVNNKSVNFVVKYHITDVFGNSVRDPRTTSNQNLKKFTPKIEESDQSFIIRNELIDLDCNNTAKKINSEKIVVVRGKNQGACSKEFVCKEQFAEIQSLSSKVNTQRIPISSGGGGGGSIGSFRKEEISSFYTRKKKYDSKIKLYSKIEARGIFVLKLTSQIEELNRTIILNESETVEFEVSANRGRNIYVIELMKNGKVKDIEKLVVEFEKKEVTEINVQNVVNKKEKVNSTIAEVREEKIVYEEKRNIIPIILIGAVVLLALAFLALWGEDKLYKPLLSHDSYGQQGSKGEDFPRLD